MILNDLEAVGILPPRAVARPKAEPQVEVPVCRYGDMAVALKIVPPAAHQALGTARGGASGPSATNRRAPRRLYRRPVGVMVRGHYVVLDGRSLSEGGVLVALGDRGDHSTLSRMSLEELPVDAQLTVSMILPAGVTLVLRGRVIYHEGDHSSGHSIGIKFSLVPVHQRREIRNYVSSKQAGEAEVED